MDKKGNKSYKFSDNLASISASRNTKSILALDLDYRRDTSSILRDAKSLLAETSEFICGVKVNYHLLLPLSFDEMSELNHCIIDSGLLSIADIKLNDIDNTNRVATDYLWDSGFAAVIVNPFAGYEGGLDVVFRNARKLGKGVITLAYMSHKGADEGYGLKLADDRTIFEEFLLRAVTWGSSGVILGTTRPEKIRMARNFLGKDILIICPGSGAQGGDSSAAIDAGADYLIFGRSIVQSKDPRKAARNTINQTLSKARSPPL